MYTKSKDGVEFTVTTRSSESETGAEAPQGSNIIC
jgi:hypothetical protein